MMDLDVSAKWDEITRVHRVCSAATWTCTKISRVFTKIPRTRSDCPKAAYWWRELPLGRSRSVMIGPGCASGLVNHHFWMGFEMVNPRKIIKPSYLWKLIKLGKLIELMDQFPIAMLYILPMAGFSFFSSHLDMTPPRFSLTMMFHWQIGLPEGWIKVDIYKWF